MPAFEVKLETKVPVLWTVTVEAKDEAEARTIALAESYTAANAHPAILDNEWTGEGSKLFFDWEADSTVEVSEVEEIEMEDVGS